MLNRFALRTILLYFAVALFATHGVAQVAFNNFTTKDGLPSNEVYSTFQDHDGFLWFGTDHGVVKYNGYNFKTFTTADGLTDNTVLDIKGDDDNNIWFLTLSGGLCYFDGKKFAAHPNNDTIKKLLVKEFPTSWVIEPEKKLWMGFVNMGFAKVIIDNVTLFTSKDPPPLKSDSVHVYVLKLPDNKYVYTSFMSQRIQKVNDSDVKAFNNYDISFDFSGTNFNLLILADKKILISKEEDFAWIDTLKNVKRYQLPRNNPVLKLRQISGKEVWMLRRNNCSYQVKIEKDHIKFSDSLTFLSNTTDLLIDHQGSEWFTTLDQGIFMIPNHKVRIFTQSKLPGLHKLSCLKSNSKNLFVGLPEGNIMEINQQLNYKIFYAGVGEKWPTAIGSMTFKLNGDLESNVDPQFNWRNGLNLYHTRILQFDEHNFLVGSSNGFALLSTNKQITFGSSQAGFTKRVTELCKLTPTKYLIGTLNGLYYFSADSGYKITREPYLKDARITSAKSMNNEVFGVATRGNGIYLNIKSKFYNLTEKQGIASNLTEDIYFENDSVLWTATFKGISKVYFRLMKDSLISRIKNYTREDGLCSNQINVITGFNGFIWLATNEGLCYFRPEDLPEATTLLPLYFDNISVNGTQRQVDSLTLNHDENNILIEFNALYYKAIQGIRYKLRLKGIANWKYTDLNYVQYYSLPPGSYQFEVAAEDADGKYKSDIHTLNFIIQPRFSDTILFKILIALFILMAVVLIISSIFSYQKLKATNVIKLLQAEFKALSYQINPHFIFNVLNSIQYYILKKDTDNAVHLLGSFSLLIRRIVNNSRQQYIGIIEEVECLKEYMDLEKMRLDNKFEYTINIDSNLDIEEKNILPMIIQPLVENSIWHGIVPSSWPGIITINFKKENGAVICNVIDNGVGINTSVNKVKSQNNLSLAMKNVSERLKIIGELNDSTWAIKTEDRSLAEPMQSGTIVTIIFPALKDKK